MFVDLWVHLTFAIFAIFDLKRQLKWLRPRSNMFNISFSMGMFSYQIGRNAQWVHLFSIDFDEFSIIYLIFDGKTIFQWVHHILSIEACDAIRRELNGYISIIISVDTLCGFAPSVMSPQWCQC